jgi:hypothetical protein
MRLSQSDTHWTILRMWAMKDKEIFRTLTSKHVSALQRDEKSYQTFMKNKDINATYLFMFSPFHEFRIWWLVP